MKPCPVPKCPAKCLDMHVMCANHWRKVDGALQRTIWRLWNRGVPKPGHREACMKAIEAVTPP